jgi:RNA polymerase sigma-70 factor (ECF subfamily)
MGTNETPLPMNALHPASTLRAPVTPETDPAADAVTTDTADRALAAQIAAGDVRAFERLLRRFNRPLYRVARAIVKDDAEAEDVLQEAMLRAFRAMGSFRGDARLSTWLVRIVANEALARLRTRARRADVVPLAPDTQDFDAMDIPETAALPQDPERSALRGEMRRLIEARIDALPDAFRAVFVLRALQELSVEETAACLAIPPATVRTRFFRARSLLREALSSDIDRAYESAYEFGGTNCDRITAAVLARIAALAPPG